MPSARITWRDGSRSRGATAWDAKARSHSTPPRRTYTGAMRRTKQSNTGPVHSDAGDMWHALASLRQTHSEPVGHIDPFEHADALLSLTRPSTQRGIGRHAPIRDTSAG
ncbi:hypothetical protein GCM10009730_61050 [Streptomyces albidochromogenes]